MRTDKVTARPVPLPVARRKVRHMNDRMVWIDCEMTGLSLSDDALIEVAALVTDSELKVLGEGGDIAPPPPLRAERPRGGRGTRPPSAGAGAGDDAGGGAPDAHRVRAARRAGRRH